MAFSVCGNKNIHQSLNHIARRARIPLNIQSKPQLSSNCSSLRYSMSNRPGSHLVKSIYVYLVVSIGVLLVIGSLGFIQLRSGGLVASSNFCRKPPIRREWRSLALDERNHFTQAVNCLSTKPSRWGSNGTLYDDFALLHGRIGSWCW